MTEHFDKQEERSSQLSAEDAVLGALLISPDLYVKASQSISADNFTGELNRVIFEEIRDIYIKSGQADPITLLDRIITKKPGLDRETVKKYLVKLSDDVPVAGNIAEYCKILKNRYAAKKAREIVYEAYESGFYRNDETYEVIQEYAEKLAGLAREKQQRRSRKLDEILRGVYQKTFGEAEDLSLKTGIGTIDSLLDGIEPSDLITIAAGTGVGKTAFALQIIRNIARSGKSVMLYSQEMSDEQNAIRMIARESGVDLYKLKRAGRLSETEIKEVDRAFDALYKLPVEIKDNGGITVEDIRLDCVSNRKLDCIFVDHVGLMRLPKGVRASNRTEEMTKIMMDLKALAQEIKKPVIVLCQFNRDAANLTKPELRCLRDSGEIEQSSSGVVLLWRTKDYENDGIIGVKVAKNRQGAPGEFYMRFDAPVMAFREAIGYEPKTGIRAASYEETKELFGK